MNVTLNAVALGWLSLVPGSALPHITPTVELVSRAQAVREILADASAYFVRRVRLGKPELAELESRVSWAPKEKVVRLFIGRDAEGAEVGSVLLLKEDSRHGPMYLAVGFDPSGAISRVVITHATEEMVPWVRDLLAADFLKVFEGRSAEMTAQAAEDSAARLGAMPRYIARVVIRGVVHAAALYSVVSAP